MSRAKRIICYAVNGAGVGHLTRLLCVARWLRRFVSLLDEQPPEIIFLTSSDACEVLADEKFAAFKMPSKSVAREAGLDKLEYRRLAKHFVWQTLGVFNPDLLVVDTFPSGSFDELFQILDGPFKKSFINRCVKPEYAARATFRASINLYDTIVIPHHAHSDSAKTCQLQLAKHSSTYCSGEVIKFDREHLPSREEVRDELRLDGDERLVYISAGGGGDPSAEQKLCQIVDAIQSISSIRLLVGAGPLYRGKRLFGARIIWSESLHSHRYFHGCDAAISAAGYNSFHELLYVGVPSIFFAQQKIADDQWRRVVEAEKKGACFAAKDLEDDGHIRSKLLLLLDGSNGTKIREAARKFIPQNGASACARDLLRPLYPLRRLEWAYQVLSPNIVHELELFSNGSPKIYAEWLPLVFPQDRFEDVSRRASMDSVFHQLSQPAADELRAVLAQASDQQAVKRIEEKLLHLLTSIRSTRAINQARNLADEVSRSLAVALKRYSHFMNTQRIDWIDWVDCLMSEMTELINMPWDMPVVERMRLFRAFPRVEEATGMKETFELFKAYVQKRLLDSKTAPSMITELHLLKMERDSISRDRLMLSMESNSA